MKTQTSGRGNPSWRKGGPSPNPSGRPRKLGGAAKFNADGWSNLLTGMGALGVDKRLSGSFSAEPVGDAYARQLWRGDPMAARVVEALPADAIREGYEIVFQDDKERSEALAARHEELGVRSAFRKALEFKRAYGGSAIFPIFEGDTGDLSQPLKTNGIRRTIQLVVLEPCELTPTRWYTDLTGEGRFRTPERYRFTPRSITGNAGEFSWQEIHESRLIVFQGIQTSSDPFVGSRPGWGDSVFTRMEAVLRDYNMSWQAVAILLHDFSQAIFKIKDLAEMVAADKTEQFKARMQIVELSRSVARAIMLDADGEEFERKTTNVTGLPDLLDRMMQQLAAAAGMPVTRLMGMAPAGLNATGESDTRNWYDAVAIEQMDVHPQLDRLTLLTILERDGALKGKEPKVWSTKWCPLWQPSEKEVEETRLITAQRDQILVASQIATPEQIAKARYGGDTYSAELQIDASEIEASEEAISAEEKAALRDPNGAADPGAAGVGGAAPVGLEPAKTAFTGVQVTSLVGVVVSAAKGEISRESAAAIIELAFPVDATQAAKILGPANFKPKEPEPKANPFGGGPPQPPGAPAKDPGDTAKDVGEGEEEAPPVPPKAKRKPPAPTEA
jgi:uncharacterized protein